MFDYAKALIGTRLPGGRPTAAVLTLLLALKIIQHYTTHHKKAIKGHQDIPSPPGAIPYFGHLPALKTVFQIPEWQKKCGPIMRVRMGVQSWIFVSDARLAHELFVTHGSITSNRPYMDFASGYYAKKERGLGNAAYGKTWKSLRTLALEILSPKSVDRFTSTLQAGADRLVDTLLETGQTDGVSPVSALHFTALNFILTLCVGTSVKSLDDPLFLELEHVVVTLIEMAGVNNDVSGFLPVFKIYYWLTGKSKQYSHFINNIRDPLFHKLLKMAVDSEEDCLFKTVYEKKDEYGIKDDDVLVFLNDMINGGTDTTAVTLSWLIAIMCHHPDVQAKIRAEVDDFLAKHHRYPTFQERDQFPYLISAHKECLRYRPISLFGLMHAVDEDFVCQDYLIQKGSVIVGSMWNMHHDPNQYAEPDVFKPERFLDNLKTMSASANGGIDKRDQYNFGWGRRICPGIYLAESEMFHSLIHLFARCVIEPCVDGQGKPVYPDLDDMVDAGIVVMPKDYKVRFIPRTDSIKF